MKKVIPLVTVLFVLGFGLLGQAQFPSSPWPAEGRLFLRIDHGGAALEIGYSGTFGGTPSGAAELAKPAFCIALFSKQSGKFTTKYWWLEDKDNVRDFRYLRDSLERYLAASDKGFSLIYPSEHFYIPDQVFQVLGLGNTVLIRGVGHEGSGDSERRFFVEVKLSLNEAQKVVDALTVALSDMHD